MTIFNVKMLKKLIILFFLLILKNVHYSQLSVNSETGLLNLKGVIYKKEYSLVLKLHTNGFSLGYNNGKIPSYYKTIFYQFQLGMLKSLKEKKGNYIVNAINLSNSYKFGKINYCLPIRIGKGIRIYLSEKEEIHGIVLGYSLEGGLDLGLMKPYYLKVKAVDTDNKSYLEEIRYTSSTANRFLDQGIIYGRGSFFTGFDHISVIPGIHFNAALHFGLHAFEKSFTAIETGILIDQFISRVPIMYETKDFRNNSLFVNVYANVLFGKRWN